MRRSAMALLPVSPRPQRAKSTTDELFVLLAKLEHSRGYRCTLILRRRRLRMKVLFLGFSVGYLESAGSSRFGSSPPTPLLSRTRPFPCSAMATLFCFHPEACRVLRCRPCFTARRTRACCARCGLRPGWERSRWSYCFRWSVRLSGRCPACGSR